MKVTSNSCERKLIARLNIKVNVFSAKLRCYRFSISNISEFNNVGKLFRFDIIIDLMSKLKQY